ncbi:MAG TPA: OmpA family protein [Rhodospirillaceae bacterium]|nr:OmpA family protein [Rhodospirillaceae bacterium]
MRIRKVLAGVCLPVLVAGCVSLPGSTYELERLQEAIPAGTPFVQALTHEYTAFADALRLQRDWFNSQYFARKGLEIVQGTVVGPEDPANWSIDSQSARQEMADARGRLLAVLNDGGPAHAPVLTATAQVKFDCWVEQEYIAHGTEAVEACHRDFLAAMDVLASAAGKPAAAPAAAKDGAAHDDSFLIFFDFNSTQVTADGSRVLAEVVKTAKKMTGKSLQIIGHTDGSGKGDLNRRLALRRAEAVQKALIAAGLPADRLLVQGRGSSEPLVASPGNVPEAQNRRVVIRFAN